MYQVAFSAKQVYYFLDEKCSMSIYNPIPIGNVLKTKIDDDFSVQEPRIRN